MKFTHWQVGFTVGITWFGISAFRPIETADAFVQAVVVGMGMTVVDWLLDPADPY